uniref:Secreted protein n=1 Tax=Strongyloides venezuelensis TaxID=75913 RepID=A0A0K0G5S2_STRVS
MISSPCVLLRTCTMLLFFAISKQFKLGAHCSIVLLLTVDNTFFSDDIKASSFGVSVESESCTFYSPLVEFLELAVQFSNKFNSDIAKVTKLKPWKMYQSESTVKNLETIA